MKEAGVLFLVSKGLWAKDLVFPCLSKVEQKNTSVDIQIKKPCLPRLEFQKYDFAESPKIESQKKSVAVFPLGLLLSDI